MNFKLLSIGLLVLVSTAYIYAQDIPYRSEDTYKLSLKMEFKQEPKDDVNKVDMVYEKSYSSEPQMFININLALLKLLEDDFRIKVTNNKEQLVLSRKLKSVDEFVLKLGFAHYMKAGKSPNEFYIQFINKEKKLASRIIIQVKEDGDFMVNGERFGKI